MKDVFGWWNDARQEAINKTATLPRAAGQIILNRDWRDDPIYTGIEGREVSVSSSEFCSSGARAADERAVLIV
jgi:hypothetical protein